MSSERSQAATAFVNHLYYLGRAMEESEAQRHPVQAARARAALAHLRRLSVDNLATGFEQVAPFLRDAADPWERRAFILVGGLFGLHPTAHEGRESLAATLRELTGIQSTDRRFTGLLRATTDELPQQLPPVIRQAKSKGLPVNYRRLLFHLLAWDDPDREIQIQWARDYWRAPSAATSAVGSVVPAGEESS